MSRLFLKCERDIFRFTCFSDGLSESKFMPLGQMSGRAGFALSDTERLVCPNEFAALSVKPDEKQVNRKMSLFSVDKRRVLEILRKFNKTLDKTLFRGYIIVARKVTKVTFPLILKN